MPHNPHPPSNSRADPEKELAPVGFSKKGGRKNTEEIPRTVTFRGAPILEKLSKSGARADL